MRINLREDCIMNDNLEEKQPCNKLSSILLSKINKQTNLTPDS